MSLFYVDSMPEAKVELWESLCEELDLTSLVRLDDDVWMAVRGSESAPHLGNVYCSILVSQLKSLLMTKYPDKINEDTFWEYYNGYDTHLHINNISIDDRDSYTAALKSLGIEEDE